MTPYNELVNLIDDLIFNYAKRDSDGYWLSYSDLDEDSQNEIVAKFIDYDDRDLFSVYENEKYDDIVCAMLSMLKKNTVESEQDFSACLKKNLRSYYANRAQELIDERCGDIDADELSSHGYYRTYDRNHGDLVVRRIGG